MSIAKFSVNNSKLINMIMIIVFIFGIYTMIDIPKEEMPAVDFGAFYILINYRGVSPAEMENFIVKKIEDEIDDLENIDYYQSSCESGRATIFIIMEPNADIDRAWNDLNTEMDKVYGLPEGADDPIIIRLNMREVNEMCTVVLGGDFSPNSIREIAEDYRDEIMHLNYISKVEIAGTRDREIWVENNTSKLDQYGITLNDIYRAINLRNKNVPGGTLKFGRAEFLVRTVGEFGQVEEINDVIIKMDKNGRAIRIKDVAVVKDTLQKSSTIGKLNGVRAVNVNIFKKVDGNIIKVMDNVREKSKEFQERIPGLLFEVRNDGSIDVQNSISTLSQNALFGIILVFFTLLIFIGWRNALFAAWGIPFSFMLTFILMRQFDITMNNLSLFSLILVIGMIVDDAIIVLENIHRYREMGLSRKDAAIKGTQEIMWPVISAVATTIAAFLPMLLMKGMMGKFMRVFPIVVALALTASLIECLLILPSHTADLGDKKKMNIKKEPHKLHDWLIKWYRKFIKKALGHRLITVIVVVVALFAAISSVALHLVKFQFFPQHSSSTMVLNLETPVGTNLEKTNEMVSKIEDYIRNMKENSDVEAIVSTVGQYTESHRRNVETSNAEIKIDLLNTDDMTYSHSQIKQSIREYLDNLAGLFSYKFFEGEKGGPPTGNDIELRIKGDNFERLEYIANYITEKLEKYPGVADLETNTDDGKKEIKIIPHHDKLGLYNLTVNDISSLISTASYGAVVSKFRGAEMDEYDIIVRVEEEQIDDLSDLGDLKIRTMTGDMIPIKELADFVISSGYSTIQHYNGKRVLTITGSVSPYMENEEKKIRTPDEVTNYLRGNKLTGQKGILENFKDKFPDYQLEYGGTAEQQSEVYGSLYFALGIALLLIFTILATQFNSYVQPFIVMLTIPFAIIGVIFGLVITGLPFSMMTMIAVVALAGIVVNDSLVVVDFVNRERERGIDRWNSLINAGTIRLRPILMTTVTTIAGFMPIILSTASATQDWKPMAVSIAFGLAFATLLTLIVIPVIYSLVDSMFGKMGITRFKTHKSFKECVKD